MPPKIVIDDSFIQEWHPKYDDPKIGKEYIKYEEIIDNVTQNLSNGKLSKETFLGIYGWKTRNRSLHRVALSRNQVIF